MESTNHESDNSKNKVTTYDVAADLFGTSGVEHGVVHAAMVFQNRSASAAAWDFDF